MKPRTLGFATRWEYGGNIAVYHLLAVRPGEVLIRFAGHITPEGEKRPAGADWDRKHGHNVWVARDETRYRLSFTGHRPTYTVLEPDGRPRQRRHVMTCSCGQHRTNHTRQLAELEFCTHTSTLRI